MRKNNWIVFGICILISLFLMWLWFYLGFNRIDSPVDLLVGGGWWVVIGAFIVLFIRAEKKRREAIRTIYVSPTSLYNVERGIVQVPDPSQRVAIMESILKSLKYNFKNKPLPDEDEFDYTYVVQSATFVEPTSAKKGQVQQTVQEPEWTGTVTRIDYAHGNDKRTFEGRKQLMSAFIS